uniref:PBPe domain-containing protein n=1 Tax=Macrostomum lignano TaxID=282301 RepID=A0A1I8FJ76_9PLAT
MMSKQADLPVLVGRNFALECWSRTSRDTHSCLALAQLLEVAQAAKRRCLNCHGKRVSRTDCRPPVHETAGRSKNSEKKLAEAFAVAERVRRAVVRNWTNCTSGVSVRQRPPSETSVAFASDELRQPLQRQSRRWRDGGEADVEPASGPPDAAEARGLCVSLQPRPDLRQQRSAPGAKGSRTSCATPPWPDREFARPLFSSLGPACALCPARPPQQAPYKQVVLGVWPTGGTFPLLTAALPGPSEFWPTNPYPAVNSQLGRLAERSRCGSARPGGRYSAAALILPAGLAAARESKSSDGRILRYPGLTQQIPTDNRCRQDAERLYLHQLEPAASSLADTGRQHRAPRDLNPALPECNYRVGSMKCGRSRCPRRRSQANASSPLGWTGVSLPESRPISPGDPSRPTGRPAPAAEKGVVAIVGPTSPAAAEQVSQWNYRATERRLHYFVNLNPHHGTLGSALMDFIRSQETWGHFAIIYRDPDTLLKYELMLNKLETPVITRQWVKKSGSYKHILTDLKNAACSATSLTYLWKTMSSGWTCLTSRWFGRPTSQRSPCCRWCPPAGQYGRGSAVERMRAEIFNIGDSAAQYRGLLENMIPMAAAIVFDSIQLWLTAFTSPAGSAGGTAADDLWDRGSASGRTEPAAQLHEIDPGGHLTADAYGACEVRLGLEAGELQPEAYLRAHLGGFLECWDRLHGFNISRTFQEPLEEVQKKLQNKTLRVTTDAPFIKVKNKNDSNSPPQFDGFCIQMLKPHRPGGPASTSPSALWRTETMAPKLATTARATRFETHDRRASSTKLRPLTITYERERVIDFTTPYMSLGLSILFKKPVKTKPHLSHFCRLCRRRCGARIGAYVFRQLRTIRGCQLSPYEWYNPIRAARILRQVENQFSMPTASGSLLVRSCSKARRSGPALSTKTYQRKSGGSSTLIMISSYTANLAPFLTVERMHSPIESVEDLARQTKIKYGTLASGSTYQWRRSIQVFKDHVGLHEQEAGGVVNKTEDGIRGAAGRLPPSSWEHHEERRNCDLMKVGGLLDSKGYGIGLTTGARKLRRRWWREEDIEKPCDEASSDGQEEPPASHRPGAGVYVVLLGGMLLGAASPLWWSSASVPSGAPCRRQSISTELCQELRFASRCFGSSTRPANHLAQRAHRATAGRHRRHRGSHRLHFQQQRPAPGGPPGAVSDGRRRLAAAAALAPSPQLRGRALAGRAAAEARSRTAEGGLRLSDSTAKTVTQRLRDAETPVTQRLRDAETDSVTQRDSVRRDSVTQKTQRLREQRRDAETP